VQVNVFASSLRFELRIQRPNAGRHFITRWPCAKVIDVPPCLRRRRPVVIHGYPQAGNPFVLDHCLPHLVRRVIGLVPADKYVVQEMIVSCFDHLKTGYLRGMRFEIGGGAFGVEPGDKKAGKEVMHESGAFRSVLQPLVGQEKVIIDQKRAMIHLQEHLGAIIMQQISAHPRALRHPVEPDSQPATVNPVALDQYILGAQELDSGVIRTGEPIAKGNIMDRVSRNR